MPAMGRLPFSPYAAGTSSVARRVLADYSPIARRGLAASSSPYVVSISCCRSRSSASRNSRCRPIQSIHLAIDGADLLSVVAAARSLYVRSGRPRSLFRPFLFATSSGQCRITCAAVSLLPHSQFGDITPGTRQSNRKARSPIFPVRIWIRAELSCFRRVPCFLRAFGVKSRVSASSPFPRYGLSATLTACHLLF